MRSIVVVVVFIKVVEIVEVVEVVVVAEVVVVEDLGGLTRVDTKRAEVAVETIPSGWSMTPTSLEPGWIEAEAGFDLDLQGEDALVVKISAKSSGSIIRIDGYAASVWFGREEVDEISSEWFEANSDKVVLE